MDTKFLKINSIIDSDTGEFLEYILDEQYELASNGIPLKIYKEYNKDEVITILIFLTQLKKELQFNGFLQSKHQEKYILICIRKEKL